MLVINGKEVFTTLEELVQPNYTALILVDLQNDYIMPGGYFDRLGGWDGSAFRETVPRIKRVLDVARSNHVFVVHVQMTPSFTTESPASLRARFWRVGTKGIDSLNCIEGTWGWQVVSELAPLPGEVAVKKYRPSAFIGTKLDLLLRSNSIRSVIVTGIVASGCVLATANDAQSSDYYTIILRDCVASQTRQLNDAALLVMSRTKDIVDSEEVIKIWQKAG